jgi:hypothetical protein
VAITAVRLARETSKEKSRPVRNAGVVRVEWVIRKAA